MQWLVDNLFSIISFVITLVGMIVALVRQNEKIKIQLKTNTDAITSLQEDLDIEKSKNKKIIINLINRLMKHSRTYLQEWKFPTKNSVKDLTK